MLTSQPRHTSGTTILRTAFWHDGTEVHSGSVQEAEVQAIFSKAGRPVPQPLPAAPATPPGWYPPGQAPPLDKETLRQILKERGRGPVAIWWAVYWLWSGVGVAVTSIVGLILVVWFLDRRRTV